MNNYTDAAVETLLSAAIAAHANLNHLSPACQHVRSLALALEPMTKEQPTFCEWMRTRHPHGWVIARRTPRALDRYGERASYLSQTAYNREQAAYEAKTGRKAH